MFDTPFEKRFHIDKNFFRDPRRFGDIVLYQIGRVYCKPSTVVPIHTHLDFYELTIVTGGRGTVNTNGVSVPVESGDIYVSFSGDFHEIISDRDDPIRYDFVAMQTDNEIMHRDLEDLVSRFHSPSARIIHSENVAHLVSSALAEITAGAEYSDVILTSIFTQVFSYVIREFRSAKPIKHPKNVGEAEVLCYQIMNYIDTHVYTMKNLSELAAVTNYNYNYLSNLYKRVTSDTLVNYFKNRRLETARLLLSEGTMSVTKIASILNYSSLYIFSRAFKERYGIPPSEVFKIGKEETGRA